MNDFPFNEEIISDFKKSLISILSMTNKRPDVCLYNYVYYKIELSDYLHVCMFVPIVINKYETYSNKTTTKLIWKVISEEHV